MHILWFFFHADVKIKENVHETFINTKIPF